MKTMNSIVVSLLVLAVVAGCDSQDAKQERASSDVQKNARDYAEKAPDYGSGKQLFNPDSLLKKKDEAKK